MPGYNLGPNSRDGGDLSGMLTRLGNKGQGGGGFIDLSGTYLALAWPNSLARLSIVRSGGTAWIVFRIEKGRIDNIARAHQSPRCYDQ